MISNIDESGARAIVEHTDKLSGAGPIGDAPPKVAASTVPTQFPSESGHWYDPKTGKQVELPPRTRATTAIKRGLVPGVTSITKQAHKEAILRWKVNSAIKFAGSIMRDCPEESLDLLDDEILTRETWELLDADSEAITGRGKELHTAIELAAQGLDYVSNFNEHVIAVINELYAHGIKLHKGNTEHSFATSRYGGKIDWHNDEWLLDFKTKPNITEGKRLAYPEHAQQLAAYDHGLGHDCSRPYNDRRCANVFVGVDDAQVVFHEWKEKDLLQGWREFDALCNYWWVRNGVK